MDYPGGARREELESTDRKPSYAGEEEHLATLGHALAPHCTLGKSLQGTSPPKYHNIAI